MNWDDVLDRLRSAGFNPAEEIYIDNYGNILPLEHPEFQGRFFRCARGIINCSGLRIEVYLFPSESHLQDFLDIIGSDPWWAAHQNIVVHFPESDPVVIGSILHAILDTTA
jgi:hypothetical protein